ncbi:MAG: hypothetical protein H6732_03590 [Alphaproteobacteria bacterium]|nr:hypothetical protein [Alphaproteobacteria bacterium]
MSHPTEPLLRWLRQQIDARGHTTASLAALLSRSRAEVRKLLTGQTPMLVEDLLALGEALELDASSLGVPAELPELPDLPEPASFANQTEALFRVGFDVAVDFLFLADTTKLDDWGGPDEVLEAYRDRELPIRLDAAYHRHMAPSFTPEGVEISLSFDRLYRCRFPWSAILRVVFVPDADQPAEVGAEPEPELAPSARAPHLRLVT